MPRKNIVKGRRHSRPMANLDWKKIDELLMAGCTGVEIAGYFGVHEDTLYNRCESDKGTLFSAYSQEKRRSGESLLRHAQYDEAVRKRDRSMLIWLGKQRLDQKDRDNVDVGGKIQVTVTNYGDAPITPWKEENTKKAKEDKDTQPK